MTALAYIALGFGLGFLACMLIDEADLDAPREDWADLQQLAPQPVDQVPEEVAP